MERTQQIREIIDSLEIQATSMKNLRLGDTEFKHILEAAICNLRVSMLNLEFISKCILQQEEEEEEKLHPIPSTSGTQRKAVTPIRETSDRCSSSASENTFKKKRDVLRKVRRIKRRKLRHKRRSEKEILRKAAKSEFLRKAKTCEHRDAFPNPKVIKCSSSDERSSESAPLDSRIGANPVSAIKRLATERESFAVPSIQHGTPFVRCGLIFRKSREEGSEANTDIRNEQWWLCSLCSNHTHNSCMTKYEIQQGLLFVCSTCTNTRSIINSRLCNKNKKPRIKSNVVLHQWREVKNNVTENTSSSCDTCMDSCAGLTCSGSIPSDSD
ncbi:hypothetical protein TSAR_010626 [Trichomalopsis sarcophagae]|uniref:Uncharacterized protein n=1 Tax=Trichomalopsis sarcophagae TaxID=543379 RepID=A0A232ER03_9HYME|nr:hypothetical protein TSAR_010626 [Trichomalopsis sarcophagae]